MDQIDFLLLNEIDFFGGRDRYALWRTVKDRLEPLQLADRIDRLLAAGLIERASKGAYVLTENGTAKLREDDDREEAEWA